jgi:AraC-like DNA-binding protein
MLGIRFYPHAAASILNDKINLFNNQVANFGDVSGSKVLSLYNQLQEARSWTKRMALVEAFLLQQLSPAAKRLSKIAVVSNLMLELRQQDTFNTMETVATRYGISARYMQQLFLQYTGLTPKLYHQINRFQNSLQLIRAANTSLTSIAYECGYADQSHFIKEFKVFTGYTPSDYSIENSPVTLAINRAPDTVGEGMQEDALAVEAFF